MVFVVVSIGSGANFLGGLDVPSSDSSFRSLELEMVVSIGSTLNRLGGAADDIVKMLGTSGLYSFLVRFYSTRAGVR